MVKVGNLLGGIVQSADGRFSIEGRTDSEIQIREATSHPVCGQTLTTELPINRKLPIGNEPKEYSLEQTRRSARPASLLVPNQTLVDVLVVYGANHLQNSSLDAIRLRAELGIDFINYAFNNAGITDIRSRLVSVLPNNFNESSLNRTQMPDHVVFDPGVTTSANLVGADLVCMFGDGTEWGGDAWGVLCDLWPGSKQGPSTMYS